MMYRLDLATIPRLTPLRGDYDQNGVVDGADMLAWQRGFGSMTAALFDGADGNGNGVVDAADFNVWARYFGATGAPTVAVPELATAWLLASAALVLATIRRGGYRLSTRLKRTYGLPASVS